MKKTKFCAFLLSSILLLQNQVAFAGNQPVHILINGKSVPFTTSTGFPYVDENLRTMVPLRVTMEAAGCSVGYDVNKEVAIVISAHDRVEVPIGTDYIYNNNQKLQNDTFAVVNNGRTYLPIRIVLESMGYTVEWDNKTKTVNAHNFTLPDKPVPYGTSSLQTLTENLLNGNVIYMNGQYYATPEYANLLANSVVHYIGDDLNIAIYPEVDRFALSNMPIDPTSIESITDDTQSSHDIDGIANVYIPIDSTSIEPLKDDTQSSHDIDGIVNDIDGIVNVIH